MLAASPTACFRKVLPETAQSFLRRIRAALTLAGGLARTPAQAQGQVVIRIAWTCFAIGTGKGALRQQFSI